MTDLVAPVSDRDHIQGSKAVPTTVVEYGDYQCPKCAVGHQIIQSIQQQLGARLCFVFRHFPRTKLHPYAQHAAEATEAAARQGRFWEMHDCLFSRQSTFDNGTLVECADAIGLDIPQFLRELAADVHVNRVQEDVDSGIKSGVQETPTFFINGCRYDNACERSLLLAAIAQSALP